MKIRSYLIKCIHDGARHIFTVFLKGQKPIITSLRKNGEINLPQLKHFSSFMSVLYKFANYHI